MKHHDDVMDELSEIVATPNRAWVQAYIRTVCLKAKGEITRLREENTRLRERTIPGWKKEE